MLWSRMMKVTLVYLGTTGDALKYWLLAKYLAENNFDVNLIVPKDHQNYARDCTKGTSVNIIVIDISISDTMSKMDLQGGGFLKLGMLLLKSGSFQSRFSQLVYDVLKNIRTDVLITNSTGGLLSYKYLDENLNLPFIIYDLFPFFDKFSRVPSFLLKSDYVISKLGTDEALKVNEGMGNKLGNAMAIMVKLYSLMSLRSYPLGGHNVLMENALIKVYVILDQIRAIDPDFPDFDGNNIHYVNGVIGSLRDGGLSDEQNQIIMRARNQDKKIVLVNVGSMVTVDSGKKSFTKIVYDTAIARPDVLFYVNTQFGLFDPTLVNQPLPDNIAIESDGMDFGSILPKVDGMICHASAGNWRNSLSFLGIPICMLVFFSDEQRLNAILSERAGISSKHYDIGELTAERMLEMTDEILSPEAKQRADKAFANYQFYSGHPQAHEIIHNALLRI